MASKRKKSNKRKPIKKTLARKKPVKHSQKKPRFKYLGGTRRLYLDTKTGKKIPRYQKEKIEPPRPIAKVLGRKKAARRIAKNREASARYQRLLEDYRRYRLREGENLTKTAARNSDKFKKIIRDLKSRDPDKKAEALYRSGRIRREEIAEYVEKFEKENGGIKLELKWRVVSKKTGAVAFEGTYRECIRWLSFGTRRQRYKLEAITVLDESDGEEV